MAMGLERELVLPWAAQKYQSVRSMYIEFRFYHVILTAGVVTGCLVGDDVQTL